MFKRTANLVRIIGYPDNQHPGKWSSTVFLTEYQRTFPLLLTGLKYCCTLDSPLEWPVAQTIHLSTRLPVPTLKIWSTYDRGVCSHGTRLLLDVRGPEPWKKPPFLTITYAANGMPSYLYHSSCCEIYEQTNGTKWKERSWLPDQNRRNIVAYFANTPFAVFTYKYVRRQTRCTYVLHGAETFLRNYQVLS